MSVGYLKVILGSMFAGKTTEIIKEYNKHTSAGFKCCIINHSLDDRYNTDNTKMSTHNNNVVECKSGSTLGEIFEQEGDIVNEMEVFFINEGQFFEDLYKRVDFLINKKNKKVYVCGLDGDFQRKKFGSLLDILPLADDIIKLKGFCKECKINDAIFTHRITEEKQQMLVSSNSHIPVCRKCYNRLNIIY